MAQESIPKAYKPWLIASLVVLVLSLFLLAVAVVAAFAFFNQTATPLWVVVLGVIAVLGIGLGFAGLVGMMGLAGYRSFREGRKVQILPPEQK